MRELLQECVLCPKVTNVRGSKAVADSPILRNRGLFVTVFVLHTLCAEWAPEVCWDEEDKELQNVAEAIARSRGLRCKVCKYLGATVGCHVDTCQGVCQCPWSLQGGRQCPRRLLPESCRYRRPSVCSVCDRSGMLPC